MAAGDRHRRSRPSKEGLAALAAALSSSAPLDVARRLRGGIGAATHVLTFEDGRQIVLKRYPLGNETAALEWERLSFAHAVGLPAPAPIAFDGDGTWFGSPALVMSFIDGRADLAPRRLDHYLQQVAEALVAIHSSPISNASGALLRPHSMDQWEPPAVIPPGNLAPTIAKQIIAVLGAQLASVPRDHVLIHADFHPGNLVWKRGRLQGIVDWSGTRVGARWWELAYFRVELAMLVDWQAATELLHRYEELTGLRSTHQHLWDLLHLYDAHIWAHHWLGAFQEQGRRDLELVSTQRRLNEIATTVLDAARL